MLFGEKLSDTEHSSKRITSASQVDPFSFSALHFLRNRLMPNGKKKIFIKSVQVLELQLSLSLKNDSETQEIISYFLKISRN